MLKLASIALAAWLASPLWAGPTLRVNRPQVNIRADATVQSARIAVLSNGERVEKVEDKDEWNQVRLADGRLGWLHGDLVQELWTVTGEKVRVRASGSTAAATVGLVERGSELAVLDKRGNWFEVDLPDGQRGWIWRELIEPLQMTAEVALPPAVDEPAVAQVVAVETVESVDDVEDEEESLPEGSILNPYAEGLQREAEGDFRQALEHFETVLSEDPNHLRALLHAARAHRELGQFDAALAKLYRAAEAGEGRREMADLYRAIGQADSAAKYSALARGEVWQEEPEAERTPSFTAGDVKDWWIYAAAGGVGLCVLIAVLFLLTRRKKSAPVTEPTPRTKFARAMEQARPQNLPEGGGEERELERQIEEKREALRDSARAFIGEGNGGVGADEDALLDGLLTQLEGLRKALDAQDERARIYAELVRLQNAKIETMERELQLLRRRRRG